MKHSFKLLLVDVVTVVLLLASQNSSIANEKSGEFVFLKTNKGLISNLTINQKIMSSDLASYLTQTR